MANAETPKPTSENPQFARENRLMEGIIGALGIAKEIQDRSNLDSLTGIPNRELLKVSYAGLQTSERKRAEDATETKQQHSILMIDIDHFKQINDTNGHREGDRILRKVASLIAGNTRKRDVAARIDNDDLAARIGGEEFAVLLPRANSDQAAQVAEKIRRLAEEDGDVTLSIGVAGVDLNKSLEDNLMNADMALYDAKEHGRNKVVRYENLIGTQLQDVAGHNRRS